MKIKFPKIKLPKIEFVDVVMFFFMWAVGIGTFAYMFIYFDSKDYSMANWQSTCRFMILPGLLWTMIGKEGAKKDELKMIAKAEISAAVTKTLDKGKEDTIHSTSSGQGKRYKIEKS